MKKHLIIAGLSLITMGALTTLYVKILTSSQRDSITFFTMLRETRQLNSELNEAILMSSSGLTRDYDQIVLLSGKLLRSTRVLTKIAQAQNHEIENATKDLQFLVREKITSVETFKTKNAILRNSRTYFETTAEELVSLSKAIKDSQTREEILRVAWSARSTLKSGGEKNLANLNEQISRLSGRAVLKLGIREKLEALILHEKIIFRHYGSALQSMKISTSRNVDKATNLLEKKYQENLVASNADNLRNQTLMFVISIILSFYTVYIVYRLWSNVTNLEGRVKRRTSELEESHNIIQIQQKNLLYTAKMSALGEMAGGVAHGINNPLTIIALATRTLKALLKEDVIDRKFVEKNIHAIETTSERISKIVKSLRTFSRESTEKDLVNTTLSEILDDTLTLCQEKFKNLEVELILDIRDRHQSIRCNPITMGQVILNLLNNSYDAIDKMEHKWIRIDSSIENGKLIFSVTDSGAGIPPAIAQKIMQPFYTTKEIGKGTGLGLSISKGIVESHSGSLTLDPSCKNTKFTVQIPVRENVTQQIA